jgi:hypothetical protein
MVPIPTNSTTSGDHWKPVLHAACFRSAARLAVFTTAEKIEHLIGLDRYEEILSWGPITDLDPLRLSFQMPVMRVFLRIGLKAVLDGTLPREAARDRERERILSEMTRREFGTGDEA